MRKQRRKFVIVCDESRKKGPTYSYFFGGAMLLENKYEYITSILDDYKSKLGLHELKRTKITDKNYKDYIKVLELFFTFVRSGYIKIRIMFSPNDELLILPNAQNETYSKFYNIFIVNAFNIYYASEDIQLRLIFDDLPETKSQCTKFKQYLMQSINHIPTKPNTTRAFVKKESIEEVDSKKHTILQCIDVIVGLTDFILNTTPKEILESKRAKARHEVWKKIFEFILEIDSKFNIKETTRPVFSHKAWQNKYSHFVYHKKIVPNISTNRPRERVALRKY